MTPAAHKDVLAEVEREIACLAEKLQRLQAVAEYHAGKLGIEAKLPQTTGNSAPKQTAAKPTRFKSMNQREAAAVILGEAGKSMRAIEIATVMVAGGFPTPAKMGKLANALFTTMTRDPKRFKKVASGQWTLTASQQESSAA